MRDIFLQLAVDDLFRAKWTADIHREWINALLRNESHRDRATLERTRDRMDQATRDCLVTGYEPLIPALDLPDPDDRHVLAAAIVGRCDVIVTCNVRDFPEDAVAPYGDRDPAPRRLLVQSPGPDARSILRCRAQDTRASGGATHLRSRLSRHPCRAGTRRHRRRTGSVLGAALIRLRSCAALADGSIAYLLPLG